MISEKINSIEIISEIIAHAPFCVPRFHDFQNGAYAMISLLSSMEITCYRKVSFPLLLEGFLEVSRRHGFQEMHLTHFSRCKNVSKLPFRFPRNSEFAFRHTFASEKYIKMHFSEIHAADWPPETLLGVMGNSLFCNKIVFMNLNSEIIAYAPFWKSWNRTFQKWKRSRNHFSGIPRPSIFRKSECPVTPRVVSGGRSAAWFQKNAIWYTF